MKKKGLRRAGSFLLALSLVWGSISGIAQAENGTKPENGRTEEQPFLSGTGGSQNFRIPCMVTLNDGTIVAACDARWNHASDACGLDTIVSYSKDNGDTWNYSFANYLGDNGNKFDYNSTAFIDPAITSDGENVYMIADLFPAGIAINTTPNTHRPMVGHTGFNENDQLVLAKATDSVTGTSPSADRIAQDFDYYLEKNPDEKADSYYLLKDKKNAVVEGYTIDAFFNIRGNGVDTNLFCGDSPYFPWPTDFLYMTKSADGGATWSEPMLLNLKKNEEQTLLVGPGRGITTSSGRILFTCYEFTNGDRNSACIYSDDGGKTWERGASVEKISSEAVVTEADGRIYMFTRHGNAYYVSEDDGTTWSKQMSTKLSYNANCQLSAITYSQKIDGKTAILFSAPSSTNSRSAGKIFVGLVQDDGSLTWPYEYAVNGSNYYAYSCLSELKDGSVGLLYESGGSAITYTNLDIRKISQGAAIGNIWCTDQEGATVSDVELRSGATVSYTLNGLKEGEEVTVESSNPEAVTAVYNDGQVVLTAQKVSGLERVVITVKSASGFTRIDAVVTDTENYQTVDLKVGDSKTFRDDTGNYSGEPVDDLDSSIAEVSMTGEDPTEATTQVYAKLATAVAQFNGDEKNLENCLFTFTKSDSAENTYQISANVEGEKIYLSYKQSSVGKIPCTTVPSGIQFEDKGNGLFALKDMYSGNTNGAYLYFHKEADKLYFNRNSSYADGYCGFAVFEKTESADVDSEIYGYNKLTALDQIQTGKQYLIAFKTSDNDYYVLNPSRGTHEYNYVARVVTRQIEDGSALAVQLGTDANYNGEKKKITDCEFAFVKQDNGNYQISGRTSDQQKVYLNLQTSGQTPNKTTAANIEITKDNTGDTFKLKDINADGGRYLHFWNDTTKLYYDRCSNSCTDGSDSFELFVRDENATENALISGYKKVTELSELEGGQSCLIGRKVGNTYYIMNPSAGNNKYSYVAKVTSELFDTPENNGWTEITFKGVGEGRTSVEIGNVTYYVFVQNDVKHVTLKVGDSYTIPGEISNLEELEEILSYEKNNNLPPYQAITKFEEGTYLFGQGSHIMINQASTASGSEKGLAMKTVDLEKNNCAEYLWTVEKSGDGYSMKSSDGKYVNISGANVELKDAPQSLKINQKNGGFSVSDGSRYLNNWAEANNKVAAYTADNNTWSFYKPSSGYVFTAKGTGEVIAVGNNGKNYHITITCDHDFEDWTITTKPGCTEKGEQTRVCKLCGAKETEEIAATGHQFGEWEITKKPTAKLEGLKERVCKHCGEKETEILPALGDDGSGEGGNSGNTGGSGNTGTSSGNGNSSQPSDTSGNGAVKTGDTTNIAVFFVTAILSAVVLLLRKRER